MLLGLETWKLRAYQSKVNDQSYNKISTNQGENPSKYDLFHTSHYTIFFI